MRTKIFLESHPLHDWFPPDDEMASHVARLCILREDWWIEFNGYVSDEDIKLLDSNSKLYRRLYFLRNLVKTLTDLHETIRALNSMSVFRKALDNLPNELRNQFQAGLKFLNKNQGIITKVRNSLGGHVSHDALAKALRSMNGKIESTCAVANDPKHTHFYFARELCSTVLFHDMPPDKVEMLFCDIHVHTHAVIHAAFGAYISTKFLMP